jgi:hypothetical protein
MVFPLPVAPCRQVRDNLLIVSSDRLRMSLKSQKQRRSRHEFCDRCRLRMEMNMAKCG